MQHVPYRWYDYLNYFLIGLSVTFIGAYLAFDYFQPLGAAEKFGFSILTTAIAAGHLVYAVIIIRFLKDHNPWSANVISLLPVTLVSILLIQDTGGFASPYLALWIILMALAGMFGIYALAGYTFLTTVYYLLVIRGNLDSSVDNLTANIYLGASYLAAAISFFAWRHYYNQSQTTPHVARLSTELKAEQLKSDILLNSIADGVAVIDTRGIINLFNPAAGTISGWNPADAMGLQFESVFKFVKTADNKEVALSRAEHPLLQAMTEAKSVKEASAVLITKDDKRLFVSVVVSPILDSRHKVSGVVAVFRDVSEEKERERQLTEFISTASHEMRTPIASIEGYLSLALNAKLCQVDAKAHEYLEKAHDTTEHLGQLFKDLLTASQTEDGRMSNHPEVIEIGAFLERLVEDLRFAAEKKGLQFSFAPAGDKTPQTGNNIVRPLSYVFVDPERIREVITNLVNNAVKFTPKGSVTLGLSSQRDYVQVSIQDTGFGIPKEDIPHLFQKFYRVDNSDTRTIGGTGLGLFIAHSIVKLYKGQLWVESQVGKGSTFYIKLPRLPDLQAQELLTKQALSKPADPDPVTAPAKS